MDKEQLEQRLLDINNELEQHIKKHNDYVTERDRFINESMAHHNMLIGQRNEIANWLARFQESPTPELVND